MAGESGLPPGFPIVRLSETRPEFGFRDFAWIEPASDRPGWLADYERTIADNPLQESRRQRFAHLRGLLSSVEESVRRAVGDHQPPRTPEGAAGIALPDWLILYALDFGLEDLGSAGLSLALQYLSERQGRPIPAGVGFTGVGGTGGSRPSRESAGSSRPLARPGSSFSLLA